MYVYFGHHRCATMWTNSIIMSVCRELDLRFTSEDRYNQAPESFDDIDFFAHINANSHIVERLAGVDYQAFHVIRDPRDILVSSYFSDRYSHPVYREEFAQFRAKLNAVSFDEGLRLELARREAEFAALAQWDYTNPRIYETRFEALTANPQEEFAKAFAFLGLPIAQDGLKLYGSLIRLAAKKVLKRVGLQIHTPDIPHLWLNTIVKRKSFRKLAGRKKGAEDQHAHYRKGVAGDWVNYLQGDNKALFKQRWGQLLIDLGYEADLNW